MSTVSVIGIHHEYGKGPTQLVALDDVSLEFIGGELTAIVGPSGCGKSTLLSIIGQVLVPSLGTVCIDDVPVSQSDVNRTRLRNSEFGFLFQDFALLEHASVIENVVLPLRYSKKGISRRTRVARCEQILEELGLSKCIHRPVRLLSGGQRQRVGMARALITQPRIILADEPTGALDTHNGQIILSILKAQAEQGKTVIVATHNTDLADACHRTIALKDGRVASLTQV